MLRRWLTLIQFKSGGYFSPIVTVCFAVNLLIFFPCFFTAGTDLPLIRWLSANRPDILDGQIWRIISAGFTHQDVFHILINLLMLGFFGHVVEQRLGQRGMAALILLAVISGNLLHIVIYSDPHGVIGFSGAGYAILCAFATIAPKARVVFFVFFMPAWLLACLLVGIGALMGFSGNGGGVAHEVHLIGAAIGFISIFWQARLSTWRRRVFGWIGSRRQAVQDYRDATDQAKLDELLEKVSSEGLPSLTAAERKFLDTYSKKNQQ